MSRLARLGRLWLVCAALLVPAAQALAAWHTERVGASERGHPADPPSLQHGDCDLCLTAAALSGSAGPPTLPASTTAAVHHEAPRVATRLQYAPPHAGNYRSRAPPAA